MSRDFKAEITDLLNLNFLFNTDTNSAITAGSTVIALSSDISVDNDVLVGRQVIVLGSTADNGTYNITANTSSSITTDHTFNNTETISSEISDKQSMIDAANQILTSLDQPAPDLFSGEFPTCNDYWKNYDRLVEKLSSFNTMYGNSNPLCDMVQAANELLLIALDSYKYSVTTLGQLNDMITARCSDNATTASEVSSYLDSIRSLLADFDIAQKFMEAIGCDAFYNARPLSSRTKIDELRNAFASGGRDAVQELKNQYLNDIKINRI